MLEGGGSLAALIKLFLLDLDVPAADAEAALKGLSLERLEAMGVLRRLGDQVTAGLELVPSEDLLIACDAFQKELATSDHVLGVSSPARVLAVVDGSVTPVERALDLGTGNGHQALLASRHATAYVTAIDINPRALRFAAFNAVLNGADGIDFREGNLFEPVAGEKFDLIVCNPPYVVSPETEIAYRDGGLPGDSFCEKIVRELPGYLEPGGIGEVLVSWLHPLGGDWIAPERRWVEDSGCDALLIRYAAHQPLDYAAAWNRPFRTNPELYAEKIERWMDYFEQIGVEEISWGALIMRRREGANWFFPYTSTTERITGASDQILRLMAAQDYLASTGDEEMLDAVFVLSRRASRRADLPDRGRPRARRPQCPAARLGPSFRGRPGSVHRADALAPRRRTAARGSARGGGRRHGPLAGGVHRTGPSDRAAPDRARLRDPGLAWIRGGPGHPRSGWSRPSPSAPRPVDKTGTRRRVTHSGVALTALGREVGTRKLTAG